MDFKALRAKRNDKARSLIESSGGKVDSSDWTPDEPLKADVKTGMRPISRRAFKTGGKVDGDEAKTNLSRAPRGNIGLANTNQRVANEERDGEKHVGGFKSGGRTGKNNGGPSLNQYGKPITQSDLDRHASSTEQTAPSKLAPKASIRPMTRSDAEAQRMLDAENDGMPMKRGGKAEKFEGSAKDEAQDKKLAAKRGMSMKKWEASSADDKINITIRLSNNTVDPSKGRGYTWQTGFRYKHAVSASGIFRDQDSGHNFEIACSLTK